MNEIRKILVVGLGLMGTPIATLLMKAGYAVWGFDIIKKQVSDLVPLGLKPAKSPKDATKGVDLIILSLPTWDAVVEAVEGADGILKAAQKGQIVMDASTSPPWESKAMAGKLAKKGIEWMDVPISGSSAQARLGNMVFMAGGKKSVFEKSQAGPGSYRKEDDLRREAWRWRRDEARHQPHPLPEPGCGDRRFCPWTESRSESRYPVRCHHLGCRIKRSAPGPWQGYAGREFFTQRSHPPRDQGFKTFSRNGPAVGGDVACGVLVSAVSPPGSVQWLGTR